MTKTVLEMAKSSKNDEILDLIKKTESKVVSLENEISKVKAENVQQD